MHPLYSRRKFLQQSTALAAFSALPLAAQQRATGSAAAPTIPTHDTVLKFHPDGTPRPFAGNTVICHLPPQCLLRDRMEELHAALVDVPYREKLGLTPPDSYHMTIFPGANDQNRKVYGWPSYVPFEASIEECSAMVDERMAKARLVCELPLRVRVNEAATDVYPMACTMRMQPVDDAEERKLRRLRDQLSGLFGFRLPDHDRYQFHMTMSYQTAPFTPAEQSAYRVLLRGHVARIVAAQPILELGNPEFCTFADMYRFEPRRLLVCNAPVESLRSSAAMDAAGHPLT